MAILSTARVEGNCVKLTCGNLSVTKEGRKLYLEVNDALVAIGGKWNRKVGGHVFDCDPSERLDNAILTGEVTPPSKNGYFPTPRAIVEKLIQFADIQPGQNVLEPSAGRGAIATELYHQGANVFACELLPDNRKALLESGMPSIDLFSEPDFMKLETAEFFDRVVMNPPFERQQDIDHVLKAYSMLKVGGVLVSIMSAGVSFREDRKAKMFRAFLELVGGDIIPLPDGSFKESGTNVNTCIVVVPKEV
ncbi:MAG: SAM-dependent methyltransferase [Methanothrix sp.]